jgi:cytochrome c oxidase subunit 2
MSRQLLSLPAAALFACVLGGCASRYSSESALNPTGPQANRLAHLFWLFLAVSIAVWLLTMIFFLLSLRRRESNSSAPREPDLAPDPRRERRMKSTVGAAVALSAAILLVLLIGEFTTARATHLFGATAKNQVSIQITGHQWWWEVQYQDKQASNTIITANELVIPIGRPIEVKLKSTDVIHSFWIPNLQGKKDLVPGHPATLWLQADEVGTYWGECAEYCGFQHAQMRLVVRAVPGGEFDAWLSASRQPAKTPETDSQKRGQQVFLSSTCVLCHQISGIHAFGRIGPDLSHVGGRLIIAAGALENTHENLKKWLADPQAVKPGTQMPKTSLSQENLDALTDYLEALK